MSLNTYLSNNQEVLIDRLAQNTSQPLSPLMQEELITQHVGMNHWLSTKLAEKLGICSNIRFSYPNSFIYELIKKTNPDLPEKSPFEPDILCWKIMKLLPGCVKKDAFKPIASYLSDGSEIKTFQISKKIAEVFDQYIIFRPDMLKKWEEKQLSSSNRDEKWQAKLWQYLIKDTGPLHRAHLVENFFSLFESNPETVKVLPQRIEVFGISILPPFHLNFFERLSEYIQVDLYLLNPCREYWGDILSQKEVSKITKPDTDPEKHHIFQANPLFSSLGKSGREFFDLLADGEPLFKDIEKKTMLSHLQSQILDLKEQNKKINIEVSDTSIQVHSCHNPMREIEILHDQLLFMFEQDNSLKPHDIIVMTSDINTYAPFIQAVFDNPEHENKKISFSISDVSLLSGNNIINTFLSLLDLSRGRFGITEVIPILESSAVRKKFSFSETDISLIKSWLEQTRVRWGINSEDKVRLGLPQFPQNTWQAGLDRLLLGYALPGQNKELFNGILPYDEIEGSSAQTLGRFIDFTENLFDLSKILSVPKPLKKWSSDLIKILNNFFESDDENRQKIQSLTEVLFELESTQKLSEFNRPTNLEVIREQLKTLLRQKSSSAGFMNGGVTFCSLESSRNIPAKVICLIGMNDNSYPRISYEPGFNLITSKPKKGDPSTKNEDRYLFLETLICAKEKLYISYIGQHIRDNSIIPPSVIVSEAIDCLEETFTLSEKDIKKHLITKHPLHPFSPKYFSKGSPLFSYSAENLKCAEKLFSEESTDTAFIEEPLPLPVDEFKLVDIKSLSTFFANPAKFLLQNRLNLSLDIQEETFEDRENFTLKRLERYLVDQVLLDGLSSGFSREDLFKLAEANGMLPHGIVGKSEYEIIFNTIADFLSSLNNFTKKKEDCVIPIDITLGDFRLKGNINNLYENSLIKYRCAKIKSKDTLSAWIEHLTLGIATHNKKDSSLLSGLNEKRSFEAWELTHPDNSEAVLLDLLDLYYKGLTNPLPFFPEASFAYAKKFHEDQNRALALQAADKKLTGDEYSSGDLDDPYQSLCFKSSDCLNNTFIETATTVYGPILEYRNKVKL